MARLLRGTLVRGANVLPMSVRRSISRWPIIGPLQRRMLASVSGGGEIEPCPVTAGPARGLTLALRLPDERGFWLGTFELPTAEAIASEVRPGDTCWDVGAYLGYFSAIMARKAARPVHCFEPLAANRARLERQAALNSDAPLSILPYALGSEAGECEFLVMPDSSMGKLAQSTFQSGRAAAERLHVPLRTMDDLVATGEVPAPSFIKIDTEGAEFQVLSGGRRVLQMARPRIVLEFHGCDDDPRLLELLAELNYECRVVETGEVAALSSLQPGQHLLCRPTVE